MNEDDNEAAKNTVRDRDFNLRDPRSRKALTAWLEDLLEKLLGDNRVPWTETEMLDQDQKDARSKSNTWYKQSLIDKLPKMIAHMHDVPNLIAQGKSLFYGTGGGVGKAAAWIDCDDVVLVRTFLKCNCLIFNEHEAFDTQRPSRGPEQNLQWYQAVALGNGEAFLGDFHRKCFPISDIHVLIRDPRFCNLSGIICCLILLHFFCKIYQCR